MDGPRARQGDADRADALRRRSATIVSLATAGMRLGLAKLTLDKATWLLVSAAGVSAVILTTAIMARWLDKESQPNDSSAGASAFRAPADGALGHDLQHGTDGDSLSAGKASLERSAEISPSNRTPARLARVLEAAGMSRSLSMLGSLVDPATPEGSMFARRVALTQQALDLIGPSSSVARRKYGDEAEGGIQLIEAELSPLVESLIMAFCQPFVVKKQDSMQWLVGQEDNLRLAIVSTDDVWFVRLEEENLNIEQWAVINSALRQLVKLLEHCPRMIDHCSSFSEFRTDVSRAEWICKSHESENALEILLYPEFNDPERTMLYIQSKITWALQMIMAQQDVMSQAAYSGDHYREYESVLDMLIGEQVRQRFLLDQSRQSSQFVSTMAWNMLTDSDRRLAEEYHPDFVASVPPGDR